MTSPRPPMAWPPLISSARVPRIVLVRDAALTALAWFAFGMLCSGAITLIQEFLRSPVGTLPPGTGPDWLVMWHQLERFLLIAAILVGWLLYWTIVRAKRMRATGLDPQPPALALADHAAEFGVSDHDLTGWRDYAIGTVQFDAADRIVNVEPGASRKQVAPSSADARLLER